MHLGIHPIALVESDSVGEGSSLGPYTVVGEGATVGRHCVLSGHTVLQGPVEIGERVKIGSGCSLVGPLTIGDGVEVGAQACLAGAQGQPIRVKDGVKIGAHATIAAGVLLGERAAVEAGAVVVKNVPANAVVGGNPAKIIRYVDASSTPGVTSESGALEPVEDTTVRGVTLHRLPLVEDLRGNLSFGEIERHVPFPIKRYFLTFDVASEEARGEHAHRQLHQFLLCVHGRFHLLVDDGYRREEFVLDRPTLALYLRPLVWGVQYRFSPNAVLLGLCSDFYDPDDYIRDYTEFLSTVRK